MKTKRTVLIAMVVIAMAILGTLGNFWGEQRVQALASVPAAVATPPPPTMVNHPGDGYATIQAAVNAAGCGGTVLLAAGTYNERVLISCGARLIGAGVGQTIIDGTNLADPNGTPVIGLGNHPFVSFPFTQNYELAHLTVRAGPNTTPQGVATGWTQKVKLHHLEIIGFSSGITVDLSLDDSIHDVFIQGTGATTGRCIRFRELDLFRNQLPGGHMTGHQVHHNVLQDCLTGIDLTNTVETAVHTNRIERIRNGIRLAGVGQPEVQNNFITQSDFAGILLLNVDGSSIHHNTFCSSTAAVRYNQSANDLFGFAPSSNNTIFQNTFGPNSLGIVFADSLLGQGNTNFKNVIRSGACQ